MERDEFKTYLEINLCVPPVSGDIPTAGKYNFTIGASKLSS